MTWKKEISCFSEDLPTWVKCDVWKQGKRCWSHEREREDQELNNRMCSHNIESEPRAQTFMLHAPVRDVLHGEQNFHLIDDRRVWKQSPVGWFDCVCCVRMELHMSGCLFVLIRLYVKYTDKFLGSDQVTTFLITPTLEECTRPWSKRCVSNYPEPCSCHMCAYFLACTHKKVGENHGPKRFLGFVTRPL